jgi:hypothetical protein
MDDGVVMHYCEQVVQGPVLEPCDQPAGVKVRGLWFCEYHADALEEFQARSAQPEWAEEIRRQLQEQADSEDDSISDEAE